MASVRRLAAIMFTDMVGFGEGTQTDEAATLALLREQEGLVRSVLATHGGREVKSTGDGFLVEFESALHAVQCGIAILQRLRERNAETTGVPIILRIGIHLGDVEERGADIFGDAVNIASRIEPLAPRGGICISGQVYDQIRNKIPNRLEKLGAKTLKNVHYPVDVYLVSLSLESPPTTPGKATRTRLAVLPLTNISPDPKDEYFADGLTEELITALSKLRELRVIARTSVSQYKSGQKSVAQIAAELGVGSVLEGSVRKSGNRLRIALQLIDADSQEHIWADTFDRELTDVFALQTEIAERTATVLRLELVGLERESLRKRPTANLAAYSLYLKGIHAARESTPEGFRQAIRYLEEAIKADPAFSPAYAYLANTYLLLGGDAIPAGDAFPRAKELVAKALELEPNLSEAHTARANLALQYEQDWAVSEAECQRALTLNPSDATAHFWYGLLRLVEQRFDEAKAELRTAIDLDPSWRLPRGWLAAAHYFSGDLTSAIEAAQADLERDPTDSGAHSRLGSLYLLAGRPDDARREAELSVGRLRSYDELERAALWAGLGDREEGRQALGEWTSPSNSDYVGPTLIAALCSTIGETDQAFEWLERDRRGGFRGLWLDYQHPAFDPIRSDPRFRVHLEELHLPEGLQRTERYPRPSDD
ncbi:MAG: tetratricopeptide repeat protein [Thermoplasmata archaeon]|nr:tetratricopeptide repeat protein [Thermoplasmata archaeon]